MGGLLKACLVAIVKNEGAGIFEWVLYHHLLGFDQIIVYENGSTDDTLSELRRAEALAPLQIIDWPLRPGQNQAYNHAIETFGDAFDSFMMLDADEFLLPIKHRGLKPLLQDLSTYPHVGIHWMMYGSNGHISRPRGLVLESYTGRAKTANFHIKSIVRPQIFEDKQSRFVNPHFMDHSNYVGADRQPYIWDPRKNGVGGKADVILGADIAMINHYFTKSREDYEVKLKRANADSLSERKDVFAEADKNHVQDRTILERYPEIVETLRFHAKGARSSV